MYDTSKELRAFYDEHIRLGVDRRNALAEFRDLNLQRLTDGLAALGEKRQTTYDNFVESRNQGSYAMHTLNQCPHTDYDIDVAVIFDKASLPDDAKAARELVRDALREKCSNFTKEPEARANAVTVWYADGYHIDFAVYRKSTDWFGNSIVEHAGAEGWAVRAPAAYTEWFEDKVTTKSPPTLWDSMVGNETTVDKAQLRRIVRMAKSFARSRSGWALPGGIVITTLVCEVYERDCQRDDIALVKTLRAMHKRLVTSLEVSSPISSGASLVGTDKRKKELERLRDCLGKHLSSLDVLESSTCTQKDALNAWNAIFCHDFWSANGGNDVVRAAANQQGLTIACGLAKAENCTVYAQYPSNGGPLPKRVALRFSANPTGIAAPYQVRWGVRNNGDEAATAAHLTSDTVLGPGEPMWTSTAYKGTHRMECEIVKNGVVVQRATHIVRVGRR